MNMSVMESSNNIHVGRLISSPIECKPEHPLGFMASAQHNIRRNHNPSNVDQDLLSDGESGVSSISNEEGLGLFGDDGLIRVDEDDKLHQFIKQKFLSVVYGGLHTRVEAVHKNVYPSLTSQARFHSFLMFSRVTEKKNEGCSNVKYAWFGGSKDEIRDIFKHGFGPSLQKGIYGHGIYLSPIDSPLSSLQSSVVDEDGLRHLVLCRVILGRMEVVLPGSVQSLPRSEDFDSGVDDLLSPRNYIVWSTQVNTHILPQYVISFRSLSYLNELHKVSAPIKKPKSPWMNFPTLISELAKVLPQSTVRMIQKHHGDHREKMITRQELIHKLRRIAGDDLLVRVMKSYRDKLETSRRFDSSSSPKECKKNHGVTCVCSKRQELNSVRRW